MIGKVKQPILTGFYIHTISGPKIPKTAHSVTQREAIEEASYLMNLAIKELADISAIMLLSIYFEFISVDQY